jgi:TPR repeat protein
MYFRSGAPYEATIRKAAEAKAAKAQQERDRAAALANGLATVHRDVDTTTLSNKAGREVEEPRNAAETKAAELTQKRDHTDAPANRAPPTAAPVAAPARKLNPDELAKFMDRAKRLIAAGDISPARLLLERAADAQDPTAALMLARTYDPDVLGAQNSRSINPDPTMAHVWYQRAAQLGSADAQRRLSELQK